MRISTFPVEESEILFDFSKALSCDKPDLTYKIFDGVDFLLEEVGQSIWVEVKNFEKRSLPPKMRGGARRHFLAKMKIKTPKGKTNFYKDELRAKFVGMAATFWLMDTPLTKPIVFIVLLESPRLDAALKLTAHKHLRTLIPPSGAKLSRWTTFNPSVPTVNVAVVDANEWNARFPEYPAAVL